MIFKHKELVDACVLNNQRAQMKLYKLYYKAMYNSCYYIVNDSFVAEDIMQDAFIDAFKNIDSFKWKSSFGSWLKRIVINKAIDSIKKNPNTIALDENVIDVVDYDSDEYIDVAQQTKLIEIKNALLTLSENYRAIIVLHLFEGFDYQEISQILNLPYNNVRVRYMRAKRKLLNVITQQRGSSVN